MVEFINIQLSDLIWEYPFIPKGQDISYFIDNRKELVAVKTYKGFSYEIYREGLDIIDLISWNKDKLTHTEPTRLLTQHPSLTIPLG